MEIEIVVHNRIVRRPNAGKACIKGMFSDSEVLSILKQAENGILAPDFLIGSA